MLTVLGENNLSFIEASALDASNVELAFQNILTGSFLVTPISVLALMDYRDLPHRVEQGSRGRRQPKPPRRASSSGGDQQVAGHRDETGLLLSAGATSL